MSWNNPWNINRNNPTHPATICVKWGLWSEDFEVSSLKWFCEVWSDQSGQCLGGSAVQSSTLLSKNIARTSPVLLLCALVNVLTFPAKFCNALNCSVLYITSLHFTALHFTALYCTWLHCTALHCSIDCLSDPRHQIQCEKAVQWQAVEISCFCHNARIHRSNWPNIEQRNYVVINCRNQLLWRSGDSAGTLCTN